MNDQSRATIGVQLADGVTDLTRRHSELLARLRYLREVLEGTPPIVGQQPPPARLLEPPPPPRERTPAVDSPSGPSTIWVQAPPPLTVVDTPALEVPDAPSSSSDLPSVLPVELDPTPAEALHGVGDPVRTHLATKRDYDYFTELDDLLAHLSVTAGAEPGPPLD